MLRQFIHQSCLLGALVALSTSQSLWAQSEGLSQSVKQAMPAFSSLYLDLHQHPELSYHEKRSGERMAAEFEALGIEVTQDFGGHGVVGIYRNGEGPTVMIRADTDALPIVEETGKDYASKVTTIDAQGNSVGVMHACGHDVHMTNLVGTAQQLIKQKDQWQGTLMLVAQPAEEVGGGAKAMLKQGLFSQFPTPDHILGLHVSASVPAGKVAIAPGYALANVDSVDIRVKGRGGHGAYPHTTVDPVVLTARIVLALQTIVSREVSPLAPNVITVGSIHGGSKHNIIGNEVKLQLTLRSYDPKVREQQIAAIKRLTQGIAISAGLTEAEWPEVYVHQEESIPSTYNDPAQTARVRASIAKQLGEDNVWEASPVMAGEDFGLYGLTPAKRPITLFWLGAVPVADYDASQASGASLPSLHSSKFAPDYPATIETGVQAMSRAALDLFNHE
ncbi:M20 metallopeptidase family protein [Shewanella aquimarina]|uniref:M20 metallopeptidase family protein n=1 Tax=Shewanella aquimarina TaxID=260365 RepID=UPI002014AE10|nr:amidohydrolase [Shewanella aquimarina]MCL2908752.1 amidohydrolase [Shewanella aquimarina]